MSEPKDPETTKYQRGRLIRVAILGEELLGWGSGKRMFPEILQNYSWTTQGKSYSVTTEFIFDNDILQGRLTTKEFDILLVPGGGVGDGQAIMKGFHYLKSVRKWKKNIATFIQDGGGYIGICGGTALITDLKTAKKKQKRSGSDLCLILLQIPCVPIILSFSKKSPGENRCDRVRLFFCARNDKQWCSYSYRRRPNRFSITKESSDILRCQTRY
jgi:hypothetical protein